MIKEKKFILHKTNDKENIRKVLGKIMVGTLPFLSEQAFIIQYWLIVYYPEIVDRLRRQLNESKRDQKLKMLRVWAMEAN